MQATQTNLKMSGYILRTKVLLNHMNRNRTSQEISVKLLVKVTTDF